MTNDNATEWVTIKIPERVRTEARADERTYGDIMLAGLEDSTTIYCGCNEHSISVPTEPKPLALDVVCPECGNHYGYGSGGGNSCPCNHDHVVSESQGGLEYDDVKNACAAALREELPEAMER